jgi:uncharacterized protein (TIGR03435 family)
MLGWFAVACASTTAQTLPPSSVNPPRFAVTSVKPLPPANTPQRTVEFGCSNSGRFATTRQSLRGTLLWAFHIKAFQLKLLPAWVDTREGVFDIEAKADHDITQAECKQMVQAMLADRFQLKWRIEMQDTRVDALVVAKDGIKMERPNLDSDESGVQITINGSRMRSAAGAPADIKPPKGWTMAQLIDTLRITTIGGGRPIVDKTGLEGEYRIILDFGITLPGQPQNLDYPDISQAIQKLGLRLEPRTEPMPMLIIDRLERPDSN